MISMLPGKEGSGMASSFRFGESGSEAQRLGGEVSVAGQGRGHR
jgi:hypothetical protein